MNSKLLQEFLDKTESYLPTIRNGILVCAQTGNTYGELNTSLLQTTALKDAASAIEFGEAVRLAEELEEKLRELSSLKTALPGEQSRALLDKLTELEASIAQLSFSSDDFTLQINEFLDQSFENLGLYEPTVKAISANEETDNQWEEEFEIDAEMLEIFGEEAEELIQNIRANLERLEKNPNDRDALLEVRRNSHTLKGSAGIIGLKELSKIAHRVEDLLDYLAENEIAGNEKIFELLLTSTDCFAALASNDRSEQLTKKIFQLYENFDRLMATFESETAQTANLADPIGEKAASEFQLTDGTLQIENELTVFVSPSRTDEEKPKHDGLPRGEQSKHASRQTGDDRKPKTQDLKPVLQADVSNSKSVVRVSLEKLDDLVKITSGLVASRSVFEQRLAELEQQIGELHNSTRRLWQSTNKIETDFEADMLDAANRRLPIGGFGSSVFGLISTNPKSKIQNPKSFDPLELDRYTEFHQTMRELIETTGDTSAINAELDNLKGNLEMLFESQRQLIEEMQDKLLRLRMVSFGSLSVRLQRTVRMTADEQGKSAELAIEGENLEVDTQILDALIEPLLHLLRNAVAHGIEPPETRRLLGKPETGQIKVSASDEGTHFILTVTDDGRGISTASLKAKAVQHGVISETDAAEMSEQETFSLVFHAGLTTAEEISQISGRGVGMNIVKNAVVRQQGTISIDSETHKGTTFTIRLPMALAVTRALLVKAGEQTFAFPLKLVKYISHLAAFESVIGTGGRETSLDNQNHVIGSQLSKNAFFYLNELINLSFDALPTNADTPILVIKTTESPCVLLVDEIIKSEEIVIKPLGNPLQNLPALLGATVLGDGSIVPVLDLIYLLRQKGEPQKPEPENQKELTIGDEQSSKTKDRKILNVLIVDDSPSVRHLTSNVIKKAGWTAIVAKDGLEALDVLQNLRQLPDVILSDVEMPRMNGYELLASLQKQENLQSIPVVMITSRANQKHRRKATDLGASEYLTKPFDDVKLIETIKNLTI